jgi:acetyl esterase/lipase
MKKIKVSFDEPMVRLNADIVYGLRHHWYGEAVRPLGLSLLRPRYAGFQRGGRLPVIIWLCGGAWIEMDRNVWLPDLVFFAKHGYAVACVEYSTLYAARFPENAVEVKLAVRFLKAHAAEYGLDPDRFAIMGESAGGYLATFCALTGADAAYDKGEYRDCSSAVKAAIPWYGPVDPAAMPGVKGNSGLPVDIENYVNLLPLVEKASLPFLIIHGTEDPLVPFSQSELLYDALKKAGASPELLAVEGAGHGDCSFIQRPVKEYILDFLDRKL